MPEMLMNMLMSRLQAQNPQRANQLRQMMEQKSNPQDIMKQVVSNATPTQMEQVLQLGKQMNVPNEVLSQIQNMK